MAIEEHITVRPDIEMAQPHLLIDQRQQLIGLFTLLAGHADIGQADQL